MENADIEKIALSILEEISDFISTFYIVENTWKSNKEKGFAFSVDSTLNVSPNNIREKVSFEFLKSEIQEIVKENLENNFPLFVFVDSDYHLQILHAMSVDVQRILKKDKNLFVPSADWGNVFYFYN